MSSKFYGHVTKKLLDISCQKRKYKSLFIKFPLENTFKFKKKCLLYGH